MSSVDLPPDAPQPRLCHIVKWPDFDGYGFNLHAEKSKAGQYIGKVDEDSPAEHAGLREGDRIIEVNGVNIANENHRQVVERIKSVPNETRLLVVDPVTDKWYKEKKIVVKSTQPNVVYIKTPFPRHGETPQAEESSSPATTPNSSPAPTMNGEKRTPPMNGETSSASPSLSKDSISATEATPPKELSDTEENDVIPITNGGNMSETEHVQNGGVPVTNEKMTDYENAKGGSSHSSPQSLRKGDDHRSSSVASGSIPGSPASTKSSTNSHTGPLGYDSNGNGTNNNNSTGELNLNMSASEMRQILASRKKQDPKKVPMDLRVKYNIIQQM